MRYAAFLRAINVGGRNVPMARLKAILESLGLRDVRTVIASGNVVFETDDSNVKRIEVRIERALHDAVGWVADTFVRTPEELRGAIAACPFSASEIEGSGAYVIAFLHEEPEPEVQARLEGLESDADRLVVRGRELYWLCATRQSDSKFSNAVLERVLGNRATMRGLPTLERVLAMLGGD
ncbi:MAG: DUF1697 domain-containing protein [Fimbriimonadaceae bacterium]|nr:DUF1697 domain-containing protein [Chthonomonadaceae bacterium]MCO5296605.1 DUF1697 domain-containing protein [Fimbriimonadaceae bacterium]